MKPPVMSSAQLAAQHARAKQLLCQCPRNGYRYKVAFAELTALSDEMTNRFLAGKSAGLQAAA